MHRSSPRLSRRGPVRHRVAAAELRDELVAGRGLDRRESSCEHGDMPQQPGASGHKSSSMRRDIVWMRHNHEHIRWVVARGVRSCPWTSGRSVSLHPVSRPPPAAVRVHLSGRTWNFHIPDRRLEPDRGAARCRNVAVACLKAGNGPAPLPGTTTRALETSEVVWQPHRLVRHNTRTDPL